MARSRRRIQVRRRQMWARVVSGAMSLLIGFEPAVLQAQSLPVIPVTPQTTLDHAQNGVPLINIATPNGKGVSHNQFEQFNVNPQGLILNNSTTAGVSVLGGAIAGNANLKGGTARLILNEVTGASRSTLNGATEIFGGRAEYILANPNGITCDGCGFINTPQATLTTGAPVWGSDGSLAGLRVNGGDIAVSGAGLDAREVDAFDLVARSVFIDAPINGKDVAVVGGRNTYDTKTRQATALADDGSAKPLFAIDSSALGGMYAGRIALIGTEAGVGVRMDGELATSTAGLTLSSNGRLEVRKASAAGDVSVTTTDALQVGESLNAGGNATIAADTLTLGAGQSVGAVGNVSVAARTIAIDGTVASGMATDSGTTGSGTLTATATETLSVTGTASARGDLALSADALDVSGTATTAAQATLSGRQVTLSGQANADHVAISATEDATVAGAADAATLAEVSAGRDLKIETTGKVTGQQVALSAARDATNAGTAKASGDLTVTAGNALANAPGATLQAGNDLSLSANAVSNAGTLQSGNDVKVAALTSFANSDLLFAGKSLTVAAATVANNGGVLLATDDIYIGGANGAAATEILNAAGVIETANGDIRLVGASVRNVGAQTAEGLTTVLVQSDYYAMESGVSRPSCPYSDGSCKGEYWKKVAAVPDARPGYTGTSYYGTSGSGSVTSQIYEQQVTSIGGSAAMITSGRDLFITGETIENIQGTVSATRDIAMTGDSLTNQGLLGTGWWQINVSNSKTTRCYGDSVCAWFSNGGGSAVLDSWSIELAPAIIQAGRSLTGSFTDRIDNTSIRAGYTQTTDTYKALIDQIRAQSVDWGSNASLPQSQAALDAYLGATMPGFSSLYTTATASSTYVYETRVNYTNLGTFYGSDYFFSRAGLAPVNYEDLPKRLGDAYFDTQYIRDQVIAETGARWLDPTVADDSAQLKALIDNAAAVAGDLHLAVGVSLTADQIAALDRDIVWYETTMVDGQEVLVPRLYLADATRAQITPTGSLIAAADSIDLKAVTVVNAEGKIDAGKTLTVAAADDIYNVSGKLVSGGDMTLTAGGDISAETQLATMADGKRNAREIRVGETGIASGGNLKLDAGGDVTISGASVKVGGDATIAADGDVAIQAVAQSRHEEEGNKKEGYRLDSLTHSLSNVEVGGTTTVTAGKDLTVQGANIASGGKTDLTAGGDVTVAAVTDTYSLESWKNKKSFGGSSSAKGKTQSATTQRSSVTSGADLSIVSNKDGLVVGSTIRAKEALSVDVKGDLTIASAQDTFSKQESRSKSSGFNLGVASYNSAKSSTSSVSTVTNVSSELSGKNVNLSTGTNLNVQTSDVIADQDITLDVGGDLNVVAGADVTETQSQKQKSSGWSVNIPVYMVDISAGKTSGKSQADSVYNEKAVASNITAGNDLTIDVGNDAHINGSNLTAGNDANVTLGGDLSVTTSQDVHQESHETSKFSSVSGGVGYAGYNVNVSKGKSKGAKTTERDIVNQGSSFKAGNNLNLKADNLAMSSGKLEADQDIQLTTTGDTTFTTAVDVHETSTSQTKGTTTGVGASYGSQIASGKANGKIGVNVSAGTSKTSTTTNTDLINQGTEIAAGRNINGTSGGNTTLTNTDVTAGGTVDIAAGGDVNLLAVDDQHITTDVVSKTKSVSVGVQSSVSLNVDKPSGLTTNGDGTLTTGEQSVGVSQTHSTTTTTTTTTTETVHKGTTIVAGGTTTVAAGGDTDIENTETTGKVLADDATVVASGAVNETTLEDGSTTTSIVTKISSSSTSVTGPDLGQFARDTVASMGGEIIANEIGAKAQNGEINTATQLALHGAAGCAIGAVGGGDCASGAVGAVVGEAAAMVADKVLNDGTTNANSSEGQKKVIKDIGSTVAQVAAGLSGLDATTAGKTATNAIENNYLTYDQNKERYEANAACDAGNAQACQRRDELNELDKQLDYEANTCEKTGTCLEQLGKVQDALASYDGKYTGFYGIDSALEKASMDRSLLGKLVAGGVASAPLWDKARTEFIDAGGSAEDFEKQYGESVISKRLFEAAETFALVAGAKGTVATKEAAAEKIAAKSGAEFEAKNPSDSIKLNKQLGSQQQLYEAGTPIAGAGTGTTLKDANRLANEYGGSPSEWTKRTSSQHVTSDGRKFETHWYENSVTGMRVEPKTIIEEYLKGPQ